MQEHYCIVLKFKMSPGVADIENELLLFNNVNIQE